MNAIALRLPSFPAIFGSTDRSVSRILDWEPKDPPEISQPSRSVSIDDARMESIEALFTAAAEASQDGWDGFDGRAVAPDTFMHALELLESLPSTVSQPEISVHPDGQVSFYWTGGQRRTVVVAVSSTGLLSFASLHGQRRLHGSEYLVNGLPSWLAFVLRQLHTDDA